MEEALAEALIKIKLGFTKKLNAKMPILLFSLFVFVQTSPQVKETA